MSGQIMLSRSVWANRDDVHITFLKLQSNKPDIRCVCVYGVLHFVLTHFWIGKNTFKNLLSNEGQIENSKVMQN